MERWRRHPRHLARVAGGDAPATHWYGIMVPAKTPRSIVMRLNKDVSTALLTPGIKELLFKQGLDSAPESPEAFGAYIKSEHTKWAKVVKAAGLKAE